MSNIRCRNCGFSLSKWQNGRLRIHVQSRVIGITRAGDVEIVCPECKLMTKLPLRMDKAVQRGTADLTPETGDQ